MTVLFAEGRGIPREFTQGDLGRYHYGDAGQDAANFMRAASPWDFLTGVFVTKPAAEQAAQVALAQTNAQAAAVSQENRQETLKTAMMIGAGVLGLLAVVMVMRPRRAAVAGYRRSKRRTRRSRR